ncbi:hypothetical protein PPERSA_00357 [Pseudocohnilembus persalinus]|uniref:Uncharacterized protein n=1 Tax=Pseudocohnilembus persalinus TaxID=266149 RepID=A0A0V0QYT4_PSEPJ|nr:hypothetical protein PPERSA_00357 [Pseudocohnilembus persalinus]|eukprot:KRX07200.1 hypothetical protein PPERSA_00357 [Pseudocohnilembus persalinus]
MNTRSIDSIQQNKGDFQIETEANDEIQKQQLSHYDQIPYYQYQIKKNKANNRYDSSHYQSQNESQIQQKQSLQKNRGSQLPITQILTNGQNWPNYLQNNSPKFQNESKNIQKESKKSDFDSLSNQFQNIVIQDQSVDKNKGKNQTGILSNNQDIQNQEQDKQTGKNQDSNMLKNQNFSGYIQASESVSDMKNQQNQNYNSKIEDQNSTNQLQNHNKSNDLIFNNQNEQGGNFLNLNSISCIENVQNQGGGGESSKQSQQSDKNYSQSKDTSELTKIAQEIKQQSEREPQKQIKKLASEYEICYSIRNKDYIESQRSKTPVLSCKDTNQIVERLTKNENQEICRKQQKYLTQQPQIQNVKQNQGQNMSNQIFYENVNKQTSLQKKKAGKLLLQNKKDIVKNFYYQQLQKRDKNEKELQEMRDKKAEQDQVAYQDKPLISQKSLLLAAQKNYERGLSNNIFERLQDERYKGKSQHSTATHQKQKDKDNIQQINNKKFSSKSKSPISERYDKYKGLTIDQRLYMDAKERIQKKNSQHSTYQRDKTPPNQKMIYNSSSNRTNVQMFISKFEKEFLNSCQKNMKNPDDQLITYLEMVEILNEMGFINPDNMDEWVSGHQNSSSILAQKIWYVIKNKKGQFSNLQNRQHYDKIIEYGLKRNFLIFLLAIQKVYNEQDFIHKVDSLNELDLKINPNYLNSKSPSNKMANQMNPDDRLPDNYQKQLDWGLNGQNQNELQKSQEKFDKKLEKVFPDSEKKQYGYQDDLGNLTLFQEEILPISQEFIQLNLNKLAQNNKKQFVQLNQNGQNNIPKILKNSEILAQQKKERLAFNMQQANPQKLVQIDLASMQAFQKQQLDLYLQNQRESKEYEEMRQCTFFPKTNDFNKIQRYLGIQAEDKINNFNYNNPNEYNDDNSLGKQYIGNEMQQQQFQQFQEQSTSRRYISPYQQSEGTQRSIDLFKLGKRNVAMRDRSKEEIDYEQNCGNQNGGYINSEFKQQHQQQLQQSEYPMQYQNNDIIYSQQSKKNTENFQASEKVPLLFVDVNIDNDLDLNMKIKLKELLDQQMKSLLTKIEEENIESDR